MIQAINHFNNGSILEIPNTPVVIEINDKLISYYTHTYGLDQWADDTHKELGYLITDMLSYLSRLLTGQGKR